MLSGLIFVFTHPLNRNHFFATGLRLLWWKCNQLFFHVPAIVEFADSIVCICSPKSSYGSLIIYTKWPEYNEMKFLSDTLTSSSVFVDVGAGLGDYSLLAASKIKTGKIISFEPNERVFAELQANLRLNNLEKEVLSFPYAVSDTNGFIQFDATAVSELGHIKFDDSVSESLPKIKAVTLDAFLKSHSIRNIDMLKIDVEGAESFVFEGAAKLLQSKRIKTILFELNPGSENFNRSRRYTLDLLSRFGYSFYVATEEQLQPITVTEILSTSTTQNIIARLK